MNKVRRRLEQRAYTAISDEQFQQQRLDAINPSLTIGRELQHRKLSEARRHCHEA